MLDIIDELTDADGWPPRDELEDALEAGGHTCEEVSRAIALGDGHAAFDRKVAGGMQRLSPDLRVPASALEGILGLQGGGDSDGGTMAAVE